MNSRLSALPRIQVPRGLLFGVLIIAALLAFEVFNYSTTEFALSDLLGDLSFAGVRWATILAIAFCGIDFAGIARLFTPERGSDEPTEVWYLFGAWLLAAAMNAMLTWWGVSIAILNHETLGNAVVERQTLLRVVPIFVAVLVWLIRVLIIGTFSVAGDRLFSQAERGVSRRPSAAAKPSRSRSIIPSLGFTPRNATKSAKASTPSFRPSPKKHDEEEYSRQEPVYTRPEPTYHPISMSAGSNKKSNTIGGMRS
ncbi:MAG: hypothetical protein ACK2UW_09455 [Anaerolineales bacterium]|jgi:hypothetical protein